jgi:hypothetical protein
MTAHVHRIDLDTPAEAPTYSHALEVLRALGLDFTNWHDRLLFAKLEGLSQWYGDGSATDEQILNGKWYGVSGGSPCDHRQRPTPCAIGSA